MNQALSRVHDEEAAPADASSGGPAVARSADPGSQLKSAVDALGRVIAPTTLLTALLFYFGWVYTSARSLYFGVDPTTLGFLPQDYILRSVGAIFHPLAAALLLTLLGLTCHSAVSKWLDAGRHVSAVRAVRIVFLAAGVGLLAIGVAGVARRPLFGIESLLPPLGLFLGTGAIVYSSYLAGRRPGLKPQVQSRSVRFFSRMALGSFMVLTLFWTVGDAARAAGLGSAMQLASTIDRLPGVTLYSKQDLAIDVSGVAMHELEDAGEGSYRHRYVGLKLLIRSGGKYFLVPATWSPIEGAVLALPDDTDIRMEFTPQ